MVTEFDWRPITFDHLPELCSWFADAELARRVDVPTEQWLAHVTGPDVIARLAVIANRVLGVVQCDITGEVGSIALWVDPGLRGHRWSTPLLRSFLAVPDLPPLERIEAHVETDNEPSRRCFAAGGFTSDGRDADGFERLVMHRPFPGRR